MELKDIPHCNKSPFYVLVRMCPMLETPSDGTVTINSRIVNGTAFYFCNGGFRPNGPVLRECQPSGMWSGAETVCDRKSYPHFGWTIGGLDCPILYLPQFKLV